MKYIEFLVCPECGSVNYCSLHHGDAGFGGIKGVNWTEGQICWPCWNAGYHLPTMISPHFHARREHILEIYRKDRDAIRMFQHGFAAPADLRRMLDPVA